MATVLQGAVLSVAGPWLQRQVSVILLVGRGVSHAATSVGSGRARFQMPLLGVSNGASM